MKKMLISFVIVLGLLATAGLVSTTNGDNLIAVGPVARAMGGVGVAAPQDAISAVFVNPAAMCFGPYCPSSEMNFGGTLFMPKVDTRISFPPRARPLPRIAEKKCTRFRPSVFPCPSPIGRLFGALASPPMAFPDWAWTIRARRWTKQAFTILDP